MISFLVLVVCSAGLTAAQDNTPPVITAENIARLESTARIDFADLPEEVGEVENGWFVTDSTAKRFAVMTRTHTVVVIDVKGRVENHYFLSGSDAQPNPVHDAAFDPTGELLTSIHVEGGAFYVAYRWLTGQFTEYFQFRTADIPVQVWMDNQVWVEVASFDTSRPYYVMQLMPMPLNRLRENEILSDAELNILPFSPNNDPESIIRIGRIPPPLAVTTTEDGRVKRWNMETGEVTAEVQLDSEVGLPIYGAVNAGGDSHLVWRDPPSTALHILDFDTGENRTIVPLDGTYVPFIFLSSGADVIIGVNVNDAPIVAAWNVETGQRYDLGEYRVCSRPPDMARLSRDGTTLVIGCDTGLDIWRVKSMG